MACEQDLISLQCNLSRLCGVEERDDDVIVINGDNLHLPPMHFPQDTLTIQHNSSKIAMLYKASDSIACWAMQHKHPESLNVLEVPYARNWTSVSLGTESSAERSLKQHKWDWTYTSPYNCTLRIDTSQEEYIIQSGTLVSSITGATPVTLPPRQWVACEPGGIDINMLQARDDILFFDELLLYQVIPNLVHFLLH